MKKGKKSLEKELKPKSIRKELKKELIEALHLKLWILLFHLQDWRGFITYAQAAALLETDERHLKEAIKEIPGILSVFILEKYRDKEGGGKILVKGDKLEEHLAALRTYNIPVKGKRIPQSFLIEELGNSIDVIKGVANIQYWEDEKNLYYEFWFAGRKIEDASKLENKKKDTGKEEGKERKHDLKSIGHFKKYSVPAECIRSIFPRKMNYDDALKALEELPKKVDQLKVTIISSEESSLEDKIENVRSQLSGFTSRLNTLFENEFSKLERIVGEKEYERLRPMFRIGVPNEQVDFSAFIAFSKKEKE